MIRSSQSMSKPKIVIIAGPNEAGKTTFARAFLPREAECPRFINADLIAAGLSPFEPQAAAIKAGNRRRFAAGLKNFTGLYRNAVDSLAVYDNSGRNLVLIEWGENS